MAPYHESLHKFVGFKTFPGIQDQWNFFFPCSRESLVWWEFDKSCDIVFYSHYFGGVVFFFIIFGWCHIFLIFGRHFIFLIIFGRGHIFLSQNLDYVICSLMLGGCLIFLFGDVIFPLIIFGGRHISLISFGGCHASLS